MADADFFGKCTWSKPWFNWQSILEVSMLPRQQDASTEAAALAFDPGTIGEIDLSRDGQDPLSNDDSQGFGFDGRQFRLDQKLVFAFGDEEQGSQSPTTTRSS